MESILHETKLYDKNPHTFIMILQNKFNLGDLFNQTE